MDMGVVMFVGVGWRREWPVGWTCGVKGNEDTVGILNFLCSRG